MESRTAKKLELDYGAVLVIAGKHKDRMGFYCLQNEQTYDMREIEICPDCRITKGLAKVKLDFGDATTKLDSSIQIETGTYCEKHQRALAAGDLAVIYWDEPYGDDYALVHPSDLLQLPGAVSTSYARES